MNFNSTQILIGLFNPILVLIFLIRKLPLSWFFRLRMYIDGIDRPYYAYGVYQAALEAKALGIKRISVCEFGVAGGHGLIILEKLSEAISKLTGIGIDVYGFDLKTGLPAPADYRDNPYIWQKGFFTMDVQALKSKIKSSTELVIGDVKKTVPTFAHSSIAPVGFIAFDLDFYTSTTDAFTIFDAPTKNILPRVFCYFDDIVGTDEELQHEYVGELLAIKEYNEKNKYKKIAKINGMYHKRVIKSTWSDMMYIMINVKHPFYNTYIYPTDDRQNVLT